MHYGTELIYIESDAVVGELITILANAALRC